MDINKSDYGYSKSDLWRYKYILMDFLKSNYGYPKIIFLITINQIKNQVNIGYSKTSYGYPEIKL